MEGHDCYSYNSVSTHIYHIIDGKTGAVNAGDSITILPNQIFHYRGRMLMMFEMLPNFDEKNNHVVEMVSYTKTNENIL